MIKSKLSMIFTNEYLDRLKEEELNDGEKILFVDVHGLHCKETKKYLNDTINASRDTFLLVVIHGYNHGTAIKEMLAYDFCNRHVRNQYFDSTNPGRTYMKIVA